MQFELQLTDEFGTRRNDDGDDFRGKRGKTQVKKGRIGEASNPGPQEETTSKTLVVQQINITQLDKNGHYIVAGMLT